MTTEEVLRELERRELRVAVGPDGRPLLRGDRAKVTPALLAVLRWHRAEIAARLTAAAAPSAPCPAAEPPPAHMVVSEADCEPVGMAGAFEECLGLLRRLRASGRRGLTDLAGTYEAVLRLKYEERHDGVFGALESLREIVAREGV